jgi:hypothetical protein
MDEEQQKKASLKGRGQDLMRGVKPDYETEVSAGQWLPEAADENAEAPHFADDEAVLRYLELNPEEVRPTLKQEALVPSVYEAPDFEALFGSAQANAQTPVMDTPSSEETRTLDDIFAASAPNFDEVFPELAPSAPLPLPGTGELFGDDLFFEENAASALPTEGERRLPSDRVAQGNIPDWLLEIETPQEGPESVEPRTVGIPRGLAMEEPAPRFADLPPAEREGATLILPQNKREADLDALFQSETDSPQILASEPIETLFPTEQESQRGLTLAEAPYTLPDEETVLLKPSELEEAFMPAVETEPPTWSTDLSALDADDFPVEVKEERAPDETWVPVLPPADLPEMAYAAPSPLAESAPALRGLEAEDEDEISRFLQQLEEEDRAGLSPSPSDSIPDLPEEEFLPPPAEGAFPLGDIGAKPENESLPFGLAPQPTSALAETQPSLATTTFEVERPLSDFAPKSPVDHALEATPLGEDSPRENVDLSGMRLAARPLEKLTPQAPEIMDGAPFSAARLLAEMENTDKGGQDSFERPPLPAIESAGEAETTRNAALLASFDSATPSEPFGQRVPRLPAKELFTRETNITSDKDLLGLFIDDNRLRELFEQIEALQEEIVENVRGERGNSDVYLQELNQATNLLTQSRESYDEARGIVYRVRADLNRERRVVEDINRYRPLLTNIYIGYIILFVVLALLGQLFISVADSVDAAWLGQGYYPALAGAVGAWLFGYMTLRKHTSVNRDFDPIHVNWYIVNPLMGLLSGFLIYLFVWSLNFTSLAEVSAEVSGTSPVTLLFAVGGGYNQNILIGILDSARQRIAPGVDNRAGDPTRRNG